jgi:hypothetical protein
MKKPFRLAPAILLVPILCGAGGCVNRVFDRWTGVALTRELQQTGEPGTALVLRIDDTGMTLNDDPVALLRLEVHPRQGDAYEATAKVLIPRLHVPQFQPGATVPVRVDPRDKMRVAVDVYRY